MLLQRGQGGHATEILRSDAGIFTLKPRLFRRQLALAQKLLAFTQKDQLVDHTQRTHTTAVGGIIEGVGHHGANVPVTDDHHPHTVGIAAAAGFRVIGGGDLEALAERADVQRHALLVDILARVLIGHPEVADKFVAFEMQLHQARGGAGDGRAFKGIAGGTEGYVLRDMLGALCVFRKQAGAGLLALKAFDDAQVLHDAAQLRLLDAYGQQVVDTQVIILKKYGIIFLAGCDTLPDIGGKVFATRGDAHIHFGAAQNTATARIYALRHGNRLVSAADHMNDEPLAHKRLVLRENGRPGTVHRHHGAPFEASLIIEVAAAVIVGIQLGHLLVQLLVVFRWVDGEARGRDARVVAVRSAHVTHVLHKLNGENRQKRGVASRHLLVRLGKGALSLCPKSVLVQPGIADDTGLPCRQAHAFASFQAGGLIGRITGRRRIEAWEAGGLPPT